MVDYEFVNSPHERGQWLAHRTDTAENFDINTNYEKKWPKGVLRQYHITIHEDKVNLDGEDFPHAKLINGQWPGPWIQACWGDEVQVTVTNKLTYNGTAIHMHGIRMLDSPLNDGVPGVTQCPIPPGDSFTYNFTATQYGTTWYHSHYSLQYTDGVLGPLTIHGPASANFDNAIDPIILGDHNHRSAFEDYYKEQLAGSKPGRFIPTMTSILINGKGNYAGVHPERLYTKHVEPGKRKILRLINTSTDSTYIFSVDGHELQVIGADLVPIQPYTTTQIAIGIGQRYHAILHTKTNEELNHDGAYWIRVQPAAGCHNFETMPDARQGILYYGDKTAEPPIPTTIAHRYSPICRDEKQLEPILEWKIPEIPKQIDKTKFFNATVALDKWLLPKEYENDPKEKQKVNDWEFLDDPAYVDYMGPTALYPDGPGGDGEYPKNAVIHKVNSRGSEEDDWQYMLIIGTNSWKPTPGGRRQTPAAHPIHLHGHDFALLKQSKVPYNDTDWRDGLNYFNPPRRDVVLLESNGYIVIAFKTDNPGSWVMHCHIAWHASAGLAIQVLEDVDKFKNLLENREKTPAWQIRQRGRTCDNWIRWQNDISKHHDPAGRFQDDSGI
ncbi:uncharacterized protein LDX57_001540 [Aspergillus melleus]|uniref:uncharacterized protein n=1 Tax=Aspergillus melleus TaxID=138277 RepID=UPI001E8E7A95|nr:uncharacterized protein LDX57_001540 [Aspergillus melleus]KAH8423781.1 hypothetical protein LDX57_001540 [Aspergillus melleus]